MRKISSSFVIAFSAFTIHAMAQVGISTSAPASTLDIAAKNATGTAANVDGLLIPRIDRERAQSMTAVPISTMVYISSIATGTQAGTALNIDAAGYYYYNGTVWVKLNPTVNLYNSNGDLSGNRVVTQGANTLSFTGTAVNSFSVDGTTLSVDAANHRLGIGTSTPKKLFHVNGALQVVNELNVGGNASKAGSAGTSGQVLTSAGTGAAPVWQTLNTTSGAISSANYVQGTTAATVTEGTTVDVPGVNITLTVPAGKTQTFLFTVLGYATQFPNGITTQGTFNLLQNGVKISSAYASKYGPGGGGLQDVPVPVTFLKSVILSSGTYTFKVQFSAWSGTSVVNYIPSTYVGYNGDTEAMLTKMQVLVYNN